LGGGCLPQIQEAAILDSVLEFHAAHSVSRQPRSTHFVETGTLEAEVDPLVAGLMAMLSAQVQSAFIHRVAAPRR